MADQTNANLQNSLAPKKEPQFFICYCCRTRYQRGHYRCCAPPAGMKSHYWRERRCTTCQKCERHCICNEANPMDDIPKSFDERLADIAARTPDEWLPYRED